MVADKSCGLLLGFFEHLLIARHETARALRSSSKLGDLPSTRRNGVIKVAKG